MIIITMRSQYTLSFISFLFLFSIFFFPSTTSPQTLIQQTCRNCSDTDPNLSYDFCATSLQSSPDSRRYSSDIRHVGLLAIRLTKQNVTSTRRFVKRLLRNGAKSRRSLDPYVKACLSDCMELYGDAYQTVRAAARDYKKKRYDDANIGLSSVADAATTCEDGFKERDDVTSPLTERNGDVFQLSSISLAIINMLST